MNNTESTSDQAAKELEDYLRAERERQATQKGQGS